MQASGYELRVLRGFRVQFPWDTYHGLLRRHGKTCTRAAIVVHDVFYGCWVFRRGGMEANASMVLYEFFPFLI